MAQISLAQLINPNPCNEAAERSNWQNLQQIFQILEEMIIININEDNSQYIFNIENVENLTVENLNIENVNIENFEVENLTVNHLTVINNFFGPDGEYCPPYCHCDWTECLDLDLMPDELCFEVTVEGDTCENEEPVEGKLVKTVSECDGIVWAMEEEEEPLDICCNCAPPPPCCGCEFDFLGGFFRITLSGGLTGTFDLTLSAPEEGECGRWSNDSIVPGGQCSAEFQTMAAYISCEENEERPIRLRILGGGAQCAADGVFHDPDSHDCGEGNTFDGTWTIPIVTLLPPPDQCTCDDIVVTVEWIPI